MILCIWGLRQAETQMHTCTQAHVYVRTCAHVCMCAHTACPLTPLDALFECVTDVGQIPSPLWRPWVLGDPVAGWLGRCGPGGGSQRQAETPGGPPGLQAWAALAGAGKGRRCHQGPLGPRTQGCGGPRCRPQPSRPAPSPVHRKAPARGCGVRQGRVRWSGKAGRGVIPKSVTPATHLVISLSPEPSEGPAPQSSRPTEGSSRQRRTISP